MLFEAFPCHAKASQHLQILLLCLGWGIQRRRWLRLPPAFRPRRRLPRGYPQAVARGRPNWHSMPWRPSLDPKLDCWRQLYIIIHCLSWSFRRLPLELRLVPMQGSTLRVAAPTVALLSPPGALETLRRAPAS
eukprot:2652734-Pyramimonas_sp.AAC.1